MTFVSGFGIAYQIRNFILKTLILVAILSPAVLFFGAEAALAPESALRIFLSSPFVEYVLGSLQASFLLVSGLWWLVNQADMGGVE